MVDKRNFSAHPDNSADSDLFLKMMDYLVQQSVEGSMNDVERDYIKELLASGAKLYGDNKFDGYSEPHETPL